MASLYGYITVVELEAYASEDYGLIDATLLSDPNIEAKITAAEQLINTYLGTSFSGTIPDGVQYCTKVISKCMIDEFLRDHGLRVDKDNILKSCKPYLNDEITQLLDVYKATEITPIKLHRLYNNDRSVYY